MNNYLKYILSLAFGVSLLACKSDKSKPDAIVMTNEQVQDSLASMNQIDADTSYAVNEYESAVDNFEVGNYSGDSGVANYAESGANLATTASATGSNNTYTATGTSSNAGKVATNSNAASSKSVTAAKKTTKKLSVQQVLARDARMAKRMPLKRFGQYMTRRWSYYRSYGDVSYQDATVEIKITDEELKIETLEGKFKREKDEIKLKTDNGKVKKETRS